MRALIVSLLVVFAAGTARADGTAAQWKLHGGSPHAGVPFQLDLIVDGFDEQPAPDVPKLDIAGAAVASIGAPQPSVSRSIQIVNGRRSDSTRVRWVLSWRVEAAKAGSLHVPAVTVVQGAKRATSEPGDAEVDTVATSAEMKLALALPERAVFVGESVPVTLSWTFKGQPQDDPVWSVPLMASDSFTVGGPPVTNPRKALTFPAGGKDLQLPYDIAQVDTAAGSMNQLKVVFTIAPRKVGKVELPAASVVAAFPVGRADFFGNAPSKLFKAVDVARTLEVKALPLTDQPADFAGAVGDQFAIDVTTSRSVVSLGEPVELAIRIKSNQRLDQLALGKLDGEGRLPKDKFTVPAEVPTGELTDDGKTKTFKVTVQIAGPATEIPALAFSYFDPVKEQYQTIKSEPVALSLKGGGTRVGANDVIAAKPVQQGSAAAVEGALPQVSADLALSSPGVVGDRPLGGTFLWVLVGLLYAIPLALFATRRWQVRTAGQREEAAEVRAARRRVEELLDRAGSAPARDVAGPLAAALRDFARALGREPGGAGSDDAMLLAKLETESFAPATASVPLSADLRSDAAGRLRRWTTEARGSRRPRSRAAAALLVLLAIGGAARAAALDEGRAEYQEAMQQKDASLRKAAFARAAAALGEAARATPNRPELLADWGNAALQAGDVATATLAYRRALLLDASNARARHNLAWLRGRQPDAFRPASEGAADNLFFFHAWPRARKLIIGAIAFALGLLALVPWSSRRGALLRSIRVLAVLPLAVWGAMLASAVLEDHHSDDAVVMDDVVVRAADSSGAPATLSAALPRGVEVTVTERRDAWTKIRLAGGASGWVPAGAVERVAP